MVKTLKHIANLQHRLKKTCKGTTLPKSAIIIMVKIFLHFFVLRQILEAPVSDSTLWCMYVTAAFSCIKSKQLLHDFINICL